MIKNNETEICPNQILNLCFTKKKYNVNKNLDENIASTSAAIHNQMMKVVQPSAIVSSVPVSGPSNIKNAFLFCFIVMQQYVIEKNGFF